MRPLVSILLFCGLATACASSTESSATAPTDTSSGVADATTGSDSSAPDGDSEAPDTGALPDTEALPDDTSPPSDLGDSTTDDLPAPNDASCTDDCEDVGPFVPTESCDPSKPPVVFVHGFLASGDTWAPHAERFMANGWCSANLRTFDWNTFEQDTSGAVAALDATVDTLLAETGAASVVLFGHSAGGGLGYDYLADAGRAAKVERYVYVGSTKRNALPAHGTPTLNLWSNGDAVISPKGDLPGATNVTLETEDHFGVATSEASFVACYQFMTGEAPTVSSLTASALTAGDEAWMAGKVVFFGDNAPAVGGMLSVFEVDADGQRKGYAILSQLVEGTGAFGPIPAKVGARYELTVSGVGKSTVHYYREALLRPNPFVYVRALPGAEAGLAGALLSAIPLEAGKAVVVAFNAGRAFHYGDDTLTLGEAPLLTEASAAPAKTLIALFLYDGDGDSATDGESLELFAGFPFLGARDTTLAAGGSTYIVLGERSVGVRLWDAAAQGVSVAVFD